VLSFVKVKEKELSDLLKNINEKNSMLSDSILNTQQVN